MFVLVIGHGCRGKSMPKSTGMPPMTISSIAVQLEVASDHEKTSTHLVEPQQLEQWLLEAIKQNKQLRYDTSATVRSYRLTLVATTAPCHLVVTAEPRGDEAISALLASSVCRTTANVKRAMTDVIGKIAAQSQLIHAEPDEILKTMLSGDPELRLVALDLVEAKKLKQAGPSVVKLLSDADPRVADRAIGVAAVLREQRAVTTLTHLAKMSETSKLAKLIDAIAAIGGAEAKDYLEFLAVSHEDSDIKFMAKDALDRMMRRR